MLENYATITTFLQTVVCQTVLILAQAIMLRQQVLQMKFANLFVVTIMMTECFLKDLRIVMMEMLWMEMVVAHLLQKSQIGLVLMFLELYHLVTLFVETQYKLEMNAITLTFGVQAVVILIVHSKLVFINFLEYCQ